VRPNGTELQPLLTPEFDRDVAFSPDGTRMAFTSMRPFSQTGVYVADADGTNESFVHSGEAPAWSPDSSQIVLIDTDGLYVAEADGSPTAKLPAPEIGGSPLEGLAHPRWRPDGGAVSFLARESGECREVYTMELDGSDVMQVTATACVPGISEYDWTPGGANIVFSGFVCTPDFECTSRIYSVNVSGGTPTELTAPADGEDLDPAVSPDGMKVAFTRFDFSGLGSWAVWVMDIDGSEEIQLTTSGADRAPAWQTLPD
jgi:Tol biopolymer transport system component